MFLVRYKLENKLNASHQGDRYYTCAVSHFFLFAKFEISLQLCNLLQHCVQVGIWLRYSLEELCRNSQHQKSYCWTQIGIQYTAPLHIQKSRAILNDCKLNVDRRKFQSICIYWKERSSRERAPVSPLIHITYNNIKSNLIT